MRNWFIGTVLVVLSPIILLLFLTFDWPHPKLAAVGFAAVGFAIQVYAAWRVRSQHERQQALAQRRHEEIMAAAKSLPPDQAIELLLDDRG